MARATSGTPRRGRRERWLADSVIAGFVGSGAATLALVVGFLIANGFGDPNGNGVSQAMYELTHNQVVSFSKASPAAAIAVEVLFGMIFAVLYGAFAERVLPGPAWLRGVIWALVLWVLSLVVFLPVVAGAGMFGSALGAGALPVIGNLIFHVVYGVVLGEFYDASLDRPNVADDVTYDEPWERTAMARSEIGGAAGIGVGVVLGAVIGALLGAYAEPLLPGVDRGGWALSVAVGGFLVGGAVGAIIGSFAALPQAPPDPQEVEMGTDPWNANFYPFILPITILSVIALFVVGLGSTLLQLGVDKQVVHLGGFEVSVPVLTALIAVVVLGCLAYYLAEVHGSSRSNHETVSQRGH